MWKEISNVWRKQYIFEWLGLFENPSDTLNKCMNLPDYTATYSYLKFLRLTGNYTWATNYSCGHSLAQPLEFKNLIVNIHNRIQWKTTSLVRHSIQSKMNTPRNTHIFQRNRSKAISASVSPSQPKRKLT